MLDMKYSLSHFMTTKSVLFDIMRSKEFTLCITNIYHFTINSFNCTWCYSSSSYNSFNLLSVLNCDINKTQE